LQALGFSRYLFTGQAARGLIAIVVTLVPDQAAHIVLVDAQTATTFGTVATQIDHQADSTNS
jgi:hypothetical protein